MRRVLILCAIFVFAGGAGLSAGDKKIRILLIGKDRDHAFGTHEYMSECELLAKCLKQTGGIDTVVSNGWPKETPRDIKAIVLYTARGGNVLFHGPAKKDVDELLKGGAWLTAIHWSTDADDKIGDLWLNTLGGWFNPKFSKLNTRVAHLQQADPASPICRGWKEYDLRDEYYLFLKFAPSARPVLKVDIDKKEHTVAWTYERPESKGGRSFGIVLGHFHSNFGEKPFRQALVNGILWTAHVDVPAGGAPCDITPKDLELPPDTRKKK